MASSGTIKLLEQSINTSNGERKPRWDMDWKQTKSTNSNSSTIDFTLYRRGTSGYEYNTNFATELYLTIKDQNGETISTVSISRIGVSSASFKNKKHNSYSFTIDHNSDGSASFEVTVKGSIYYTTNKETVLTAVSLDSTYTRCTAPTTLSFDSAYYPPEGRVQLTWSGAGTGGANTIQSYDVYLLSTSNSSDQVGTATGQYTHHANVTHNSASANQSTTFTLNSGNRGNILKVAIITKGNGGSGFNSQLSQFSSTAKVNRLPGQPVVSGSTTLPYGSGGSCLLQVSGGIDSDTNIAAPGYIVKNASGTELQGYTSTASKYEVTSPGTYYFYSHDGLEPSESAQEVTVTRASALPTTTPQVTYTNYYSPSVPAGASYTVALAVTCSDGGGLSGGTRYLKIYTGANETILNNNINNKSAAYEFHSSNTQFSISDIREPLKASSVGLDAGLYYKIATWRDDGSDSEKPETLCPTLFYIPPISQTFFGNVVSNNPDLLDGGVMFDDKIYFKVQKGAMLFNKAYYSTDLAPNGKTVDLQSLETDEYDILLATFSLSGNEQLQEIRFYTRNGTWQLHTISLSGWVRAKQPESCDFYIEHIGTTLEAMLLEGGPYRLAMYNWINSKWGSGIETELQKYGFSLNSKTYLKASSSPDYLVEIGTLGDISDTSAGLIYIDCGWDKYRELFAEILSQESALGKNVTCSFKIAIERFNGTQLFETTGHSYTVSFKKAPQRVDQLDGNNYGIFASFDDASGKFEYFEDTDRVLLGDPIYLQALVHCYDQSYLSFSYATLIIKDGDQIVETYPCHSNLADGALGFSYSATEQTPFSVLITPKRDIILNKKVNTTLSFYLVLEGLEEPLALPVKPSLSNTLYYCGRNEAILRNASISYDNESIVVTTNGNEFVYPCDPELDPGYDDRYVLPVFFIEWRTESEEYAHIYDAETDKGNLPERVLRLTRLQYGTITVPDFVNFSMTTSRPGLFTQENKKLYFRIHYIQQVYRDHDTKNNGWSEAVWRIDAYSEEFVIYDSLPTVGYRPNQLLINRQQIDPLKQDNGVLIIGPTDKKKIVYLLSDNDNDYIEIDLTSKTISGLTLNCGSWEELSTPQFTIQITE